MLNKHVSCNIGLNEIKFSLICPVGVDIGTPSTFSITTASQLPGCGDTSKSFGAGLFLAKN